MRHRYRVALREQHNPIEADVGVGLELICRESIVSRRDECHDVELIWIAPIIRGELAQLFDIAFEGVGPGRKWTPSVVRAGDAFATLGAVGAKQDRWSAR